MKDRDNFEIRDKCNFQPSYFLILRDDEVRIVGNGYFFISVVAPRRREREREKERNRVED